MQRESEEEKPSLSLADIIEAVRRRGRLLTAVIAGGLAITLALTLLLPRFLGGKAAPVTSIAVLPFENLSAQADTGFFAVGIQEEILTRLAKTGSLKVDKEADIIILDGSHLNVFPMNNVPGAVVTLMERTNVETVIVAGKVRKWKGRLLDVDLPQLRRQLEASRDHIFQAAGIPNVGVAGTGGRGTLIGSALEQSNVDIAQEFTQMILAQRGYQANSKTITVSDELLVDTLNLKR